MKNTDVWTIVAEGEGPYTLPGFVWYLIVCCLSPYENKPFIISSSSINSKTSSRKQMKKLLIQNLEFRYVIIMYFQGEQDKSSSGQKFE